MPVSDAPTQLVDAIPLAVITAREPVTGNPWISERWKVQGIVAGPASASGNIECKPLRAGPEGEQYLWTGLVLRLHKNEVDSYYYTIIGQNPSLYVYCQNDDNGEPRPRAITADYIDAMSHAESGNLSYPVPMPPEVYHYIEEFVLEHYAPAEPKLKRKHEQQKVNGIGKMSSPTDRRAPSVAKPEVENRDGDFLHRWSQRKHASRQHAPEAAAAAPAATAEPAAPAKTLTDADMPPIESLGEDSDYSPFMSPGVSETLRHQALHKLFRLPQFSQRDPLDGEYYDCHGYLPLGDTITHEMREEMEREAQEQKQAEAALANTDKSSVGGALAEPSRPATNSGPTALDADRHSGPVRKRGKHKRSEA